MHKLALTAAFCDSDHMRDLAMGRVVPEGIDLTCLNAPVEEIFYRFLMNQEFDVSELSFAKYVSLRAKGDDRFIALPIFPSRMFRHSSLYVRADCPLKEISELKGRKVGIPEWAQTAAVYSRGFLVHQYGLELKDINWVQSGVNQAGRTEKVQIQLPEGINLTRVTDRSLNDMLLSGDIDAALAARPPIAFSDGQGKVKRFFDNSREVEAAYYRETGIFPIMHVIAVRKEILDAHPWVARNLFNGFQESKRRHKQDDVTLSMLIMIFVTRSDKQREAIIDHAVARHQRFLNMFTTEGTVHRGAIVPIASDLSRDEIARNLIIGPPDYCIEQLKFYESQHIDNMQLNFSFGASHEEILTSMHDFASDVMPSFSL